MLSGFMHVSLLGLGGLPQYFSGENLGHNIWKLSKNDNIIIMKRRRYVILHYIKIEYSAGCWNSNFFFLVSSTPLSYLDAEMDRGTVPICKPVSRCDSGPLEV